MMKSGTESPVRIAYNRADVNLRRWVPLLHLINERFEPELVGPLLSTVPVCLLLSHLSPVVRNF